MYSWSGTGQNWIMHDNIQSKRCGRERFLYAAHGECIRISSSPWIRYVPSKRLYHAARLRWNSIERKRTLAEDQLIDDVAEWALWQYATGECRDGASNECWLFSVREYGFFWANDHESLTVFTGLVSRYWTLSAGYDILLVWPIYITEIPWRPTMEFADAAFPWYMQPWNLEQTTIGWKEHCGLWILACLVRT